MPPNKLLCLLQLSDSIFPTGGFSHSIGLEACLRHQFVINKGDLVNFMVCNLENAGSFLLPFVMESYAHCSNAEEVSRFDKLLHVSMPNHVANRASVRQGQSFIEVLHKAYKSEHLYSLVQALPHCHLPVVFGAALGILSIDKADAAEAFMFTVLRTILASAVRLDAIGAMEAQAVQAELQFLIPNIIQRHQHVAVEDVFISHPSLDIIQNTHDTMFSKLFNS